MAEMSSDHVGFHLGGEVTIERISDAFIRFHRVLDALGKSNSTEVRWVLAGLDYGSVSATAQAVPLTEEAQVQIAAMLDHYIDAALRVHNGKANPDTPLHRRMHKLMSLADDARPITVRANTKRVVAAAPLAPLSIASEENPISLGTVRGRVETLSRRQGFSFKLYELFTNAAVTCYWDSDHEEAMRNVWGRIADVTGTVRRDAKTDRPQTIRQVTNVEPIEEGDPAGYRRARGAIRISEPAEVLVRRMRDDD